MTGFRLRRRAAPLILGLGLAALCLGDALSAQAAGPGYAQLLKLFDDWRAFEAPVLHGDVADYTPAAMALKAQGLAQFQARLHGLDTRDWSKDERIDYQLVQAELNGLDFDLRVRQPWARDPSFYATVFDERSDVPAHEGPSAAPNINLYEYAYPLSLADQKHLTARLRALPAFLDEAKANLKNSNARDLWLYGARALREQAQALAALEAGTLNMRTLEGHVHGGLEGAGPELRQAVKTARLATEQFADWIAAEAPKKTGPSGVGKENYTWYERHVHLVPYSWEEQVVLLRRELERAQAALRLEEFHNRKLPPLEPVSSPEAYVQLSTTHMNKLVDFMIDGGIVADKAYYRAAMNEQRLTYVPPQQRDFFAHTYHREPMGLFSHDYHWIELARLKFEPNPSPIRRVPPLSNIFDARSEGLATAVEEMLMHAGLYDDAPRGREIVWIMAANRAARGLASLYVQANELTLAEAGKFHAQWTPRGWSDPNSKLVGFEQRLYLSQPGYGSSYITGKLQFDRIIAEYAHDREAEGKAFSLPEFFTAFNAAGVIPFSLIEQDLVEHPLPLGADPAAPAGK